MIWIVIVLVLATAALLAIYGLLRGSLEHPRNLAEMVERLRPINPASLQHLASRREDEFLRKCIPNREYRRLRTMRMQALRSYYSNALQNCSLLLAYGQLLGTHADPVHVQFGRDLCRVTLQLRFALWRGLAEVFFCSFAPYLHPYPREIFELYYEVGFRLSAFSEQYAPGLHLIISRQFSL
jgi:hypothetical protein